MAEELRCTSSSFEANRFKDDNLVTASSLEQKKVEETIGKCYGFFKNLAEIEGQIPELHRFRHEAFLRKGFHHLSQSYECLDASRPWLCYWILHSMELLSLSFKDRASSVTQFLGTCQSPTGGFGGGPGHQAHLAPTYAAVNALCILGTEEAYSIIDRPKLQQFLIRLRTKDGAYKMHEGGEVDIRGAYCAASVARLTNVAVPDMFDGTPEWIAQCQTYEGGFGGCPGMEAHGGYSFCGLAALVLLGQEHMCDVHALLEWTVFRQMPYEGGFQGRTNKLVDGCYSFWQGGALPLLHTVLTKTGDEALSAEEWMFHQQALQEYILICCQFPAGGLVDKPGKPRDYYHTCYCLSGLSMAQHFAGGKLAHSAVVGPAANELNSIHPVFNIGVDAAVRATQHFKSLPIPGQTSTPGGTPRGAPGSPQM